jgi:hypothetical protein
MIVINLTGDHDTEAMWEQARVLQMALKIYSDRNIRYKDNFKRFGWRGCLFRLRERSERAWDDLWDADVDGVLHTDDLIDLINFAAFTVRSIQEKNRDGEGSWW